LVAPVEIGAGFFRIGEQAQPRIFGIERDRVVDAGMGVVHAGLPPDNSRRRRRNSGVGSPPDRRVMCSALKLSGTSAAASGVSSMHTGRMNTAPSEMLRARSTA